MAAERNEKAGAEGVWRCVFGGVCGRKVRLDGLSIRIMYRKESSVIEHVFDRQKWQSLTIFEQMGNIGSEVGRAFAARRRGDTAAMTGA